MKTTSGPLKAALQANLYLLRAQLYTLTFLSGTVLRYCDWTTDLVLAGHTYTSTKKDLVPGFIVGKTTTAIGMQVDSTDIVIAYDAGTLMLGMTPGALAQAGAFDGCKVSIDTLFMLPSTPGDTSLGTVNRYTGIVDEAKAVASRIEMMVSSPLAQFSSAFPRNYATPQCNHALFDSGCTLTKSSFAIAGTVTSGASPTQFTASGLGKPAKYFAQGSIVWLTGPNAGQTSQVTSSSAGGVIILIYPLVARPTAGDTFTAYPGCAKTRAACGNTNSAIGPVFNNLIHFRGFPYVPTPTTIVMGGTTASPGDTAGGSVGQGGGGVARGPGGQSGITAAK